MTEKQYKSIRDAITTAVHNQIGETIATQVNQIITDLMNDKEFQEIIERANEYGNDLKAQDDFINEFNESLGGMEYKENSKEFKSQDDFIEQFNKEVR
jgi:hypothetical protein